MRFITILDVETSGLNPLENDIIEIAAILYDLLLAEPITSYAAIVSKEENLAIHVNGISNELSKNMTNLALSEQIIRHLIDRSEAIVSHSIAFDRSFINGSAYDFPDKPWICSLEHIKWPKKTSSRTLMAIAIGHGVAVVSAHRAMVDCDILARLLTRVHETGVDLSKLMEQAMRPRVLVQALVDYEDRQLAKDANFTWDGDKKKWLKEIPEEDIDMLPFQCRILQNH